MVATLGNKMVAAKELHLERRQFCVVPAVVSRPKFTTFTSCDMLARAKDCSAYNRGAAATMHAHLLPPLLRGLPASQPDTGG